MISPGFPDFPQQGSGAAEMDVIALIQQGLGQGDGGVGFPGARRAGYLLALIHRRDDQRYDLDGKPAGEVDALARSEAVRLLGEHQKRQKDASTRHRKQQTLEKQEQRAKAERIAERKRRAAEKQRRREEHERNRQRGIERRAAEARAQEARAAARRGEKPPLPTVIHKKRRRVEPREPDPKTGK